MVDRSSEVGCSSEVVRLVSGSGSGPGEEATRNQVKINESGPSARCVALNRAFHSDRSWLPTALDSDVAILSQAHWIKPMCVDGSDYVGVQSTSIPELPCLTVPQRPSHTTFAPGWSH